MKHSPYFCYLISLRSKYSLWYSIVKYSFHVYRENNRNDKLIIIPLNLRYCITEVSIDFQYSDSSGRARSNAGIVGSNPTRGMDVCVRLFCVCAVLCVGSGLTTGWSPVQGVLRTVYGLWNWKSGQGPQGLQSHR
jgi:hypothetical protein